MTETPHARLESRNGGRAVFDGVRVDGQVAGMLLDVSSVQTFRNPGTRHVELVYTFPLPADAVLLSMRVRLGERQLTGKVVEKQEARAIGRTHGGGTCRNYGAGMAAGRAGHAGRRPYWVRKRGRPRLGGLTDEKKPVKLDTNFTGSVNSARSHVPDCATLALPLKALPPLLLQQLPRAAENPPEQIAE